MGAASTVKAEDVLDFLEKSKAEATAGGKAAREWAGLGRSVADMFG